MPQVFHLTEEQQEVLRPHIQQILTQQQKIFQVIKFGFGSNAVFDPQTMTVTVPDVEEPEEPVEE